MPYGGWSGNLCSEQVRSCSGLKFRLSSFILDPACKAGLLAPTARPTSCRTIWITSTARYWLAVVLGESSGGGSRQPEASELPFQLSGWSVALLDKDVAVGAAGCISKRSF